MRVVFILRSVKKIRNQNLSQTLPKLKSWTKSSEDTVDFPRGSSGVPNDRFLLNALKTLSRLSRVRLDLSIATLTSQ